MATALFVCLHNAGRSQIVRRVVRARRSRPPPRALGRNNAGRARAPEVVAVMRELDIDVADRVPHKLTRELAERADVVVTMGCGDECPYVPGKRYVDWDLQDPKGRPLEEVRATRDDIARRVQSLVEELDGMGGAGPIRG